MKKLQEMTRDELREMYELNDLEDVVRGKLREDDGEYVYEQMEELRDIIRFEVDAWDNVYARPNVHAARCGEFAEAIRASIYSYPSPLECYLKRLERYAEGVERLGGCIWDVPGHFEDVIDEAMQDVCDVYAHDFKMSLNWWMDADEDEVFDYFANYPEFFERDIIEYPEDCEEAA